MSLRSGTGLLLEASSEEKHGLWGSLWCLQRSVRAGWHGCAQDSWWGVGLESHLEMRWQEPMKWRFSEKLVFHGFVFTDEKHSELYPKKKKDRNSASCNVMCFGRGALNKLDMVDNFISFTPPTIIFSQLAKICFVNQRNPSNSSCSEQDRYKKGALSGRKRAALCEKGEQGNAFLYVLPILCSLVTS